MNLKNVLLNLVLFSTLCVASLYIYHNCFKTKTAYIEIKKVFNGFQMKKELEQKYNVTASGRQKLLDSLSFSLKLLSKTLNEQKNSKSGVDEKLAYRFEYQRDEFLKIQNQFAQDNSALSQKMDSQILEQLTQYVMEFGKKNNYDIIMGADGNGNLMFAKESYNISDDVIEYVNNKYKGRE